MCERTEERPEWCQRQEPHARHGGCPGVTRSHDYIWDNAWDYGDGRKPTYQGIPHVFDDNLPLLSGPREGVGPGAVSLSPPAGIDFYDHRPETRSWSELYAETFRPPKTEAD